MKVTAGHMLLARTYHCLIATYGWDIHNTQCCSPIPYTHTVYIELDGGRQAGRKAARGREGARENGEREGGRKRWCEAGREREWRKGWRVEGGRVNKGTSEEIDGTGARE